MYGLAFSIGAVVVYLVFLIAFLSALAARVRQPGETPLSNDLGRELGKPDASYSFAVVETMEETDNESDIRVAQARTQEKVEGLAKTVEREFNRLGEVLSRHADSLTAVVREMESRFVSKAENLATLDRLTKLERIVYGVCGVMLLSIIGTLLANVIVP